MPSMQATNSVSKKEKQKKLTESLKLVKQTVKAANEEADILRHFPVFTSFSRDGLTAIISSKHASQLPKEQKDAIWQLFEGNMKDTYQADKQKWNPKDKKRELFSDEARYLLAATPQQQLLAFSHFRFEVEENVLTEEEMERHGLDRYGSELYCYELQLDPAVHRKGLGKRLMQVLELVALKYQMQAVLLTVQKSNAGAALFYTMMGYKQHPSCPERNGFEDFDGVDPGHRILWKDLRR